MKIRDRRKLIELFEAAAKTQHSWGPVTSKILEAVAFNEQPPADLLEDAGIFPHMLPQVIEGSMAAFKGVQGLSLFNYIASLRYRPGPFYNAGPNPYLMFRDRLPVIVTIATHAERCLSPLEKHVLFAIALYEACHKRSPQDLGEELGYGRTKIMKTFETARKKLVAHLKAQGSDLAKHPALRSKYKYPKSGPKFRHIGKDLEFDCDLTNRICALSSTIFDARHHAIMCDEYFFDPSIPRDRKKLAKKYGCTPKGYEGLCQHLYTKLENALAFEPDYKALLDKLETLRAGILHKGLTHSKLTALMDTFEPDFMDLRNPVTKLLYEIAFEVGEGHEAPVFCMNTLYRAEHKFSTDEFTDYTPETIGNASEIKRKIIRVLEERGLGFIAEHPVLRMRKMPLVADREVKTLMHSNGHLELYTSLKANPQRAWDTASSILNPRQFYIFTARAFCNPKPTFQAVATQVLIGRNGFYVPSPLQIESERSALTHLNKEAQALVRKALLIECSFEALGSAVEPNRAYG